MKPLEKETILMDNFDPKQKSKGLGDTIAKITHATGLDKVADAVAKAAGKEDCGCNRRRRTLNEIFPYTKQTEPAEPPHINTIPLDEVAGEYLVLQEIHCTLEGIGATILNIGTTLVIDKNHPLYNDIPHYYKINAIKKI